MLTFLGLEPQTDHAESCLGGRSDIFYFFLLGEGRGKGESEAPGLGGGIGFY